MRIKNRNYIMQTEGTKNQAIKLPERNKKAQSGTIHEKQKYPGPGHPTIEITKQARTHFTTN